MAGDAEVAREWLDKLGRTHDGEAPLEHADTYAGAREVENLIDGFEYGVYASCPRPGAS